MLQEEIKKRIEAGWYHLTEIESESNYTISTPTDHLYWQLTFPPKFKTENERVLVEVKPGGPPDQEEVQRTRDTSVFRKEVIRLFSLGDITRLKLDLDKPKIDHRYRIRWRPCL